MKYPRITRRDVMAGAGAVLAGSVLLARYKGVEEGAHGTSEAGPTVMVLGGRHAVPREMVRRFAGDNAVVVQLEADPVRQWRGAQGKLLTARATHLMGVTTWPQFLLVRGLAEESGRRVRFQRVDVATGEIVWQIA